MDWVNLQVYKTGNERDDSSSEIYLPTVPSRVDTAHGYAAQDLPPVQIGMVERAKKKKGGAPMIASISASSRAMRALFLLASESEQAAKVAELSEQNKLAVEYYNQAHDYIQVAQMLRGQIEARTPRKRKK